MQAFKGLHSWHCLPFRGNISSNWTCKWDYNNSPLEYQYQVNLEKCSYKTHPRVSIHVNVIAPTRLERQQQLITSELHTITFQKLLRWSNCDKANLNYDKLTEREWYFFSKHTYVTDLGQLLMIYPAKTWNNSDAFLIYTVQIQSLIYCDVANFSYRICD